MLPAMLMIAGCGTMSLSGTDKGPVKAEKQVEQEIAPAIDEIVCNALGQPITWSSRDTEPTKREIEIYHNSTWREFNCKALGDANAK